MMDDRFFAWLDGELDPAEAAEMERRVAADPELTRMAAQHRALGQQLHGTFAQLLEAPVPEPLQAGLKPSATVADLSAHREQREQRNRWRTVGPLPQWAAMAATLAVGIVAGTMVRPSAEPVEQRGNAFYAAADLDRTLDTQLASAPGADVRIGLTFRDSSGAICRTFTGEAASGLACREGEDWRIRGLLGAPEGQDGDYRMAAGADPNLAALVDSVIEGEPLDAEQEAQTRSRGWR